MKGFEMNVNMIKGLEALKHQYEFVNLLIESGDAEQNPQYYLGEMNHLRGMRDMFQIVYGDAPYTYAACKAMLAEA